MEDGVITESVRESRLTARQMDLKEEVQEERQLQVAMEIAGQESRAKIRD